jgi:serine/threonine protein kinase
LSNIESPFLVQLHYAFQTKEKLYLVMDFMRGGELFFHLKQSYKFSERRARFFISELILGI